MLLVNKIINKFKRQNLFYEIAHSAKVEGVHKEFQKMVNAGVCRFLPDTGNLVLISNLESSQKRAHMLQEMYFRNLSQKVKFLFYAFKYRSRKLHTQSQSDALCIYKGEMC